MYCFYDEKKIILLKKQTNKNLEPTPSEAEVNCIMEMEQAGEDSFRCRASLCEDELRGWGRPGVPTPIEGKGRKDTGMWENKSRGRFGGGSVLQTSRVLVVFLGVDRPRRAVILHWLCISVAATSLGRFSTGQ